MSIISGLLTGGILIGKVCQALSKSSSNREFIHDGVTITGEVSSGGITFYRKETNGESAIYAANPSIESSATIVVPNENNLGGIIYVLNPLSSIPFAEAESSNVSPTTAITTGLTENTTITTSEMLVGKGNSLLKLAFTGLGLGKTINIGSFTLSCNTTQLVILSSSVIISNLTYMSLNSDKGVSAMSQDTISPNSSSSNEEESFLAGTEQTFNINFDSLGINPTSDSIEGQITFEIDPSITDLSVLSKIPSRPFEEIENQYFKIK